MALAGRVFHVEFGINETKLTQTLERKDYKTAEFLIKNRSYSSYLDEGCYRRTPLFIVLCGVEEDSEKPRTRNFYLARLLVEFGANLNHRVPETYYGCEYVGPGKTALELLVDFYNDLTHFTPSHGLSMWPYLSDDWDPVHNPVIGLNNETLVHKADVIEHIESFLFVLIGNGADVNLCDEDRLTSLHRTCIHSNDPRVLRLFVENGADINAVDNRGNTPLLSLCDITASDMCDYFDDLSPCTEDFEPERPIEVKTEFLDYLLSRPNIKVNHQNHLGQTALFHCVVRGDVEGCHTLLKAGASPVLKGTVWKTRRVKRRLSPLFVTYLSLPAQRGLTLANMMTQSSLTMSKYSHLVDAGYFKHPEITEELQDIISTDFPDFKHLQRLGSDLIPLMFGKTTQTLRQQATAIVFRMCLLGNSKNGSPNRVWENKIEVGDSRVKNVGQNLDVEKKDELKLDIVSSSCLDKETVEDNFLSEKCELLKIDPAIVRRFFMDVKSDESEVGLDGVDGDYYQNVDFRPSVNDKSERCDHNSADDDGIVPTVFEERELSVSYREKHSDGYKCTVNFFDDENECGSSNCDVKCDDVEDDDDSDLLDDDFFSLSELKLYDCYGETGEEYSLVNYEEIGASKPAPHTSRDLPSRFQEYDESIEILKSEETKMTVDDTIEDFPLHITEWTGNSQNVKCVQHDQHIIGASSIPNVDFIQPDTHITKPLFQSSSNTQQHPKTESESFTYQHSQTATDQHTALTNTALDQSMGCETDQYTQSTHNVASKDYSVACNNTQSHMINVVQNHTDQDLCSKTSHLEDSHASYQRGTTITAPQTKISSAENSDSPDSDLESLESSTNNTTSIHPLSITRQTLRDLIRTLNLPTSVLIHFDIELLRCLFTCHFCQYRVLPPSGIVSDGLGFYRDSDDSYSTDSDSAIGGVEGDSDLEYW